MGRPGSVAAIEAALANECNELVVVTQRDTSVEEPSFLLELPWSPPAAREIDIALARQVLEEDHFNLKDVKERILERIVL